MPDPHDGSRAASPLRDAAARPPVESPDRDPPSAPRADVPEPGSAPAAAEEHSGWGPMPPASPTTTELGGLLFLVPVAQRLGLYADFTEPAAPGIALDPWRFVALIGARLVDRRHYADDPAWALLAELAREDDHPSDRELDRYIDAVRVWLESHLDLPAHDVLTQPALVYTADTRVDAVFSLIGHPIEIRLAGIDIDPGWIPAAGRALYFHFE